MRWVDLDRAQSKMVPRSSVLYFRNARHTQEICGMIRSMRSTLKFLAAGLIALLLVNGAIDTFEAAKERARLCKYIAAHEPIDSPRFCGGIR